jgi:hypothetical protein
VKRNRAGAGGEGARRRAAVGAGLALLMALAPPSLAPARDRAPAARSPEPAIPAQAPALPIAVLPFDNLGDTAAPVERIRAALWNKLADRHVALVDDQDLLSFMRRHRMRYIGGLGREMGRALQAETGARAVLVASVDLYAEKDPPKLALTCRLVSAGEETRILWMDGAALDGDEAPGFLGLGRIADPRLVLDRVTGRLADSLGRFLTGEDAAPKHLSRARASRRFRPDVAYRLSKPPAERSGSARVAVLPFADESSTRRAGEVLSLRVLRSFVQAGGVEVVEPGVVRDVLLSARLIQEGGPSMPQADLLRSLLDVDVVVFGEVTDYTETGPGILEPSIDFSVRAIDTGRRQVVWSSMSHARGDEGVFFFDVGRVPTAHALADEMARGLIEELLPALETSS